MASLYDTCPHCLTQNPAFGSQRCTSCQLNMMSDQEFAQRQQLEKDILAVETLLQNDPVPAREIQLLLQQLAPYGQQFPFVADFVEERQAQIAPLLRATWQVQRQKAVHLGVLLVLLIAPLLASLWQGPLYLVGLFMLPVLGWLVLGIWPLWRGNRSLLLSVLCLLTVGVAAAPAQAQPDNGQLYQQLWQGFLRENGPFSRISGQKLEEYFPTYETDSSSQRQLQVFAPELHYALLPGQSVQRQLQITYNVKDSLILPGKIEFVDTLSLARFREIHRSSPADLRGDSPTIPARWLQPIALLTVSIAGIVALFYVRSR